MSECVMGQSDTKVVKESWGDGLIPVSPPPAAGGKRMVLLIKARGLPTLEICHKPSSILLSNNAPLVAQHAWESTSLYINIKY